MNRAATWPSGTRVSWRGLTWGEYQKVNALSGPSAEKALEVYKLCVSDGPTPDRVPAGIMLWIFQYELENSPFSGSFQALSGPLQAYRDKVNNTYLLSAQAFIASVFKIPFEAMDNWDSETFLCRIAQAEFVSGVPLNPVDPKTTQQGQAGGKGKRPKKPFTPAQEIAIERHQNDRANVKSRRSSK